MTEHQIGPPSDQPGHDRLWQSVGQIIDRAPSLEDLRAHRLHLLAARHWRMQGRVLPRELAEDEAQSSQRCAAARLILLAARAAYDGELLILKGLDAAAYYPSKHLRPFADIDLLADDADRAHRDLVAAGFLPLGYPDEYYVGLHHLSPLSLPAAPSILVEVHRRPNWYLGADPPATAGLFSAAVPASLGVPGLVALPAEEHALVLAAHAWAELPFRRLLDLVDVTAVATGADPERLRALARSWGMERLWDAYAEAIAALFFGGPKPSSLQVWARNLESVRDRTVLETHIRRCVAPFWALPPGRAAAVAGLATLDVVRPAPADSWQSKMTRSRRALAGFYRSAETHTRLLGPDARRAPRFRRR
jgi:hypothetical protein